MFCVGSKPSSWLSSSSIVRCTSESPPSLPSTRLLPMESISSMKMIDGAASRAITNSSRTMRDPFNAGDGQHRSRARGVKGVCGGSEKCRAFKMAQRILALTIGITNPAVNKKRWWAQGYHEPYEWCIFNTHIGVPKPSNQAQEAFMPRTTWVSTDSKTKYHLPSSLTSTLYDIMAAVTKSLVSASQEKRANPETGIQGDKFSELVRAS